MNKKSLVSETAGFGKSLLSRTWNAAKNTVQNAWTGTKKGVHSITSNIGSLLGTTLALTAPAMALAIPATYAIVKTAQAALVDILWDGNFENAKKNVKKGFTDPYHVIKKGVKGTLNAVGGIAKGGATIIAAPIAAVGDSLGTNQSISSTKLRKRSAGKTHSITPPSEQKEDDNESKKAA